MTSIFEKIGRHAVIVSFLVLAAGCGGSSGGGGGGGPAPVASPNGNQNTSSNSGNQNNGGTQTNNSGVTVPQGGTVPDTWFVNDDPASGQLRSHDAAEQAFADRVLELTNDFRVQNGLPRLFADSALDVSAKVHAEDMARRGYFDHDTQDFTQGQNTVSGFSPFVRMGMIGATYSTAAENIAAGQNTPDAVVNAWINSSGHRANMLNPNVTHLGVGYASGGSFGDYWVQNFRAGGNAP
ncbi:MAG: CAP domain-containing protein [Planctomycetota bacterium]|nr:CAP domain-containing protein [Planctomycetota bacterium]